MVAGTSASGSAASATAAGTGPAAVATDATAPAVVLTPAPSGDLAFIPTYPTKQRSASDPAEPRSNAFGSAELTSAAVFLGAAVLIAAFGVATTLSSRRRARNGIAKPLRLSLR